MFIDPKYTKPHYRASIFKGYLIALKEQLTVKDYSNFEKSLPLPIAYLSKDSNWVSELFSEKFFEVLSRQPIDLEKLSYTAGQISMSEKVLSSGSLFIAKFMDVESVVNSTVKITSRFAKPDKVSVVLMGENMFQIMFESGRQTKYISAIAANWAGHLEAVPSLVGEDSGKCQIRMIDDNKFIATTTWKQNRIKFSLNNSSFVLATIFLLLFTNFLELPFLSQFKSLLLFVVGLLSCAYILLLKRQKISRNTKKKNDNIILSELLQDIENKYRVENEIRLKLDRRYKEANLLSQVIQTISKYMDKKEIINSAIAEIHQRLGYDRVLVMEYNEHRNMLLATQSVGFGIHAASILDRYQVRLLEETSEEFHIGNVFKEKRFTKINVTDEYLESLSENGKKIVQASGASSFVIGCIATERKKYGVMLVDYLVAGQLMTDDDIHIIRNVCAQIAISLENAESFYQETLARKTFQKYVPKEIVERLLSDTGTSFDSVVDKDITVLFYDLRNFTYRSTKSDHQSLRDILNIYHETLSNVVYKHGGIVDKFLGDGFLAIFNAFEDSDDHTSRACAAAYEMKVRMNDIADWIRENAKNPEVWLDCEIGIGINCGTAGLCYLGTSDKQEYTAIGTTVNTAARLAELSKKHGDRTIVSKEVVKRVSDKFLLSFAEKTKIRGLTEEWDIFILEGPKEIQSEGEAA